MPSDLLALPLELLRTITGLLNLRDFCSLRYVSKALFTVLGGESTCLEIVKVCKAIINGFLVAVIITLTVPITKNCILYSREAKLAKQGRISYEKAVTNAFRTREAYASARPFSAMTIGFGSEFIYREGILCYLRGYTIRVVNVHEAGSTELVFTLPPKLYETMDCRIKLMSYQDNILVIMCIPRSSDLKSVIVAVNSQHRQMSDMNRVQLSVRISRSSTYFIRHDKEHLVYGYYSDINVGWHGHREWQFWQFGLTGSREGQKLPKLLNHPGMDIGTTVVFEIFDGYFYVLSNQSSVDTEEPDPESFYHVNRYNLNDGTLQGPVQIWRRRHREGPIHDSWTEFALQRDECSGNLNITETRREWQDGHSDQKRTFYIEPLVFPSTAESFVDPSIKGSSALATSESRVDSENSGRWTPPPDPMLSAELIVPIEQPSPLRRRIPRRYHPEYAGSQPPSTFRDFRLAQTKFRTYNCSCMAFLDIVLDDQTSLIQPQRGSQIRLRVQSRTQSAPLDGKGFLRRLDIDERTGNVLIDSEDVFVDRGTKMWPLLTSPPGLVQLLNPGIGLNGFAAQADERSVVYTAGSGLGKDGPIILINFDPAIQFPGLGKIDERTNERHEQSIRGPEFSDGLREYSQGAVGLIDQKRVLLSSAQGQQQENKAQNTGRVSRFKIEKALWQELGQGYQLH